MHPICYEDVASLHICHTFLGCVHVLHEQIQMAVFLLDLNSVCRSLLGGTMSCAPFLLLCGCCVLWLDLASFFASLSFAGPPVRPLLTVTFGGYTSCQQCVCAKIYVGSSVVTHLIVVQCARIYRYEIFKRQTDVFLFPVGGVCTFLLSC